MADREDRYRNADDLGSRSPASEEAQQQGRSGDRGSQAGQTAGERKQVSQTSQRRPAEHEQTPEERRHFAEGHAPSEQGEKDHPSPEAIASRQQGISRQSGDHAGTEGDRSEERAMGGEPRGEHAFGGGRQHIPGSREQNQKDG